MSSDTMNEESSVREGVGYDEAFGSGVESKDFSPSSGRETSTQSLDGEDECYAEESEEIEIEVGKEESWVDGGDAPDGEEGDGDDGEGSSEGALAGPGDNRPFILPAEWAVNKFLTSMSDKIFSELASSTKSPSTSQSISLMRTKSVTREGLQTLGCTTLCLRPDLDFC